MKKILLLFIATFTILSVGKSQSTKRINAIKANDYGVVYSLPQTSLVLTLKVKKSTYNRGEFYQYAQRYLGIENPIIEDKTVYTLENISVLNKGIPDKSNSFMIEFKSNSVEPFVYLTDDGLICSVNSEPIVEPIPSTEKPIIATPLINPKRFLSEETLMAGSSAKQAELVSKQILDLRRSRNDILIGEAPTMPPDGEAYKVVMDQINMQEKALTEMFSGVETTETFTTDITIIPDDKNIDKRVVARFSQKLGPLDRDNLAGEPVYLNLTNKTQKPDMMLTEKEIQKLETKLSEGLVYNIPGKANLKVEYKNKLFIDIDVDIAQYGSKDVLTKNMFDSRKQPIKVIFYPELGAIRQIIQ